MIDEHTLIRAVYSGLCYKSIKKFFLTRVGTSYEKAVADLAARIPKKSEASRGLRSQLKWLIDTEVIMVDGKPVPRHGLYIRGGKDLYVDPNTGFIQIFPAAPKVVQQKPITDIKLGENEYYELIKGIWYHVKYNELPSWVPYFKNRNLDRLISLYPTIKEKRQLSKKEIRTKVLPKL